MCAKATNIPELAGSRLILVLILFSVYFDAELLAGGLTSYNFEQDIVQKLSFYPWFEIESLKYIFAKNEGSTQLLCTSEVI